MRWHCDFCGDVVHGGIAAVLQHASAHGTRAVAEDAVTWATWPPDREVRRQRIGHVRLLLVATYPEAVKAFDEIVGRFES